MGDIGVCGNTTLSVNKANHFNIYIYIHTVGSRFEETLNIYCNTKFLTFLMCACVIQLTFFLMEIFFYILG